MSQDLRRERAGAQFETIAGATNYIAQLEAENAHLKGAFEYNTKLAREIDHLSGRIENLECKIAQLREALGYVCMYADEADIRAYAAEALARNRA